LVDKSLEVIFFSSFWIIIDPVVIAPLFGDHHSSSAHHQDDHGQSRNEPSVGSRNGIVVVLGLLQLLFVCGDLRSHLYDEVTVFVGVIAVAGQGGELLSGLVLLEP
jgi:hypothetical protein